MSYRVITSFSSNQSNLEKEVSAAMDEGWIPQGGISVSIHQTQDENYYAQAMVRADNPKHRGVAR